MFWLLLLILAGIPAILCTKKKPKPPSVKQKKGMPRKQVTPEMTPSSSDNNKTETKRESEPKKENSLKFKTLTSSAESLKTDLRSIDDGPNPLLDAEIREKMKRRLEKKKGPESGGNKKEPEPVDFRKTQYAPPKSPTSKLADSDGKKQPSFTEKPPAKDVDEKSEKTQPDNTLALQPTGKTEEMTLKANPTMCVTLPTTGVVQTPGTISVMQTQSVMPTTKKASEINCTLEGLNGSKKLAKLKKYIPPQVKVNDPKTKTEKAPGAVKINENTQRSMPQSQLEVQSTMKSQSNEVDKKTVAAKNSRK